MNENENMTPVEEVGTRKVGYIFKTFVLILILAVTATAFLVLFSGCSKKEITPEKAFEKYVSKVEIDGKYDYFELEIFEYNSEEKLVNLSKYYLQMSTVYISVDVPSTKAVESETLIKYSIKESGVEVIKYSQDEESNHIVNGVNISVEEYNNTIDSIYELAFSNILPLSVDEISEAYTTSTLAYITMKDGANYKSKVVGINRATHKIHTVEITTDEGTLVMNYKYPLMSGYNKSTIPNLI